MFLSPVRFPLALPFPSAYVDRVHSFPTFVSFVSATHEMFLIYWALSSKIYSLDKTPHLRSIDSFHSPLMKFIFGYYIIRVDSHSVFEIINFSVPFVSVS